jgi:rubrerythrin
MNQPFSISEIVKFAVEIEKEGIVFYQTMSDKTENDELKEIYDGLRDDEKLHQAIFEALLSTVDGNVELMDMDNDYAAYLNAMVKNAVFDEEEAKKKASDISSDLEAIDYALAKEKDSVVFYLNLLKLLNKEEDKETLDKVIKEEQVHMIKLLNIKEKIN